jgi:hypothetical protein
VRRRELLTGLVAAVLAGDGAEQALQRVRGGRPPRDELVTMPGQPLPPGTNVKMDPFNATGNGITNDTHAFTSARDSAGANGTVTVPPGTYVLNNLALDVAGQNWQISRGATLLLKPATAAPLMTISAAGVTIDGPGTLDGNLGKQTGTNGTSTIQITGNDVTFRNLTIQNGNGWCVRFSGANRGSVTGCMISNTWQDAICFQADGASYTGPMVWGNRIYNYERGTSSISGGISVVAASPYTVSDILVDHNEIEIYPLGWGEIADVNSCISVMRGKDYVISGNTLRGSGLAITLPHCTGGTMTGNVITGWTANGMEITNCSMTAVSGNTLIDTNPRSPTYAAGPPIAVLEVCEHVSITGNHITDITPDNNAILVASGSAPDVDDVTISANTIAKSATGNAIQSGPRTEHITLTGNVINCGGVTCDPIYLGTDDRTRTGVVIADNQIFGYGAGSAVIYGTSDTKGVIDYVTVQGNVFQNGSAGISQGGRSRWGPHSSVVNNTGP